MGTVIPVVFYTFFVIIDNVKQCFLYSENIPLSDLSEPVSLIKPMKGFNEFTLSNYNSWINQDNRNSQPIEYIFSFDEGDPGIEITKEVPYDDKVVLVNPIIEGFTGKMSALVYGLRQSSHDLVVFSDGDTRAQSDTLSKIMGQFDNGADIVTCLAVYNTAKNMWGRLYASIWNLAEIGVVGASIIRSGDQVVGNTFALYKKTLDKIGGLEKYGDFIAEDIAIGMSAYEAGLSVMLGPLIESPVGEMSFSDLMNKYSRAALYAIEVRGLRNNWQFVFLYSYLLVLLPPVILFDRDIIWVSFVLALGRLGFASYLWFVTIGEKRILAECFLGDMLFIWTYIRSFIFKVAIWSGIKYRVDSSGRINKKKLIK